VRADRARRAGTVISCRRRVAPRARVCGRLARVSAAWSRLWAIAARGHPPLRPPRRACRRAATATGPPADPGSPDRDQPDQRPGAQRQRPPLRRHTNGRDTGGCDFDGFGAAADRAATHTEQVRETAAANTHELQDAVLGVVRRGQDSGDVDRDGASSRPVRCRAGPAAISHGCVPVSRQDTHEDKPAAQSARDSTRASARGCFRVRGEVLTRPRRATPSRA
jgi:hypothetical protein